MSFILALPSPLLPGQSNPPKDAAVQDTVWAFEIQSTVGQRAGADISLTDVPAGLLDEEFNIYILQPIDKQVRSFSWDGEPRWTSGRAGGGPGEFSAPKGIGWFSGAIYVTDGSTGRIATFDPASGRLIKDWRPTVPLLETGHMPVPEALLSGGAVLFNQRRTIAPGADQAGIELFVFSGSSGDEVLGSVQLPRERLRYSIRNPRNPILGYFGGQPFADNPLLAIDPNGEFLVTTSRTVAGVVANSNRVAVTLTRIEFGRTAWKRTYMVDAVPLSTSEKQAAYAREWEKVRRSRGPELSVPEKREALDATLFLPEVRPPISKVTIDGQGIIWLKLAERQMAERTRWLLVRGDGDLVGQAIGPAEIDLLDHRDGRMLARGEGPLGVPYLILLRRKVAN